MIWTRWGGTPAAVLAMAALCALMLALPGYTIVTKYPNDLLIFLDGAHRIVEGQVPNRDFHTALGPLAYYFPAAGYLLTGNLGSAMPGGTALVILLLAPLTAYILHSRLATGIALPLAALLLLVLAAPINLGEPVTALSFGMFYNRIGWAALALLLVMHLPPLRERRHRDLMDGAAAALVTLLLIYLKISYGLVALAFVVMQLVIAVRRRWALVALAIVLLAALAVELVWRGSAAHVADLRLAAEVSGGLRGTWEDRGRIVLANLPDYLIFALFAGVATWLTRSWRDLLFFGFCAAAGYLIMNQNFQAGGMVTLFAGGAVAAQRLLRADSGAPANHATGLAARLLIIAFLLPTIVHCAIALGLHTVLAAQRAGVDFALPNFERIRLVDLWSPGDRLFAANYINSLRNGARALADFAPGEDRVFVLDFVSPFSAGLGLEPPRGDSSWQHWGRTFNADHVLAPEDLLRDVEVVLEPKYPIERWTYDGLKAAYLDYVRANYDFAGENVDWWVYRAKTDGVATAR